MRILILGSSGLLGNAVGHYFIENTEYDVTLTYRDSALSYGPKRVFFDALNPNYFVEKMPEYDYIINCIGIIPIQISSNPRNAIYINSIFPWDLVECSLGSRIIHISTDCVFSGKEGNYLESSVHDSVNLYGKSKSLGEPIDKAMVLRTSIIGEELHGKSSLLEWAKSQKGSQIDGYINHIWNGITTKQYAKICHQIIQNNLWQIGNFHIFSPRQVSKYTLLQYFNNKFNLNLQINGVYCDKKCNRSLCSEKSLCNILNIPDILDQISVI